MRSFTSRAVAAVATVAIGIYDSLSLSGSMLGFTLPQWLQHAHAAIPLAGRWSWRGSSTPQAGPRRGLRCWPGTPRRGAAVFAGGAGGALSVRGGRRAEALLDVVLDQRLEFARDALAAVRHGGDVKLERGGVSYCAHPCWVPN